MGVTGDGVRNVEVIYDQNLHVLPEPSEVTSEVLLLLVKLNEPMLAIYFGGNGLFPETRVSGSES